MFGRRVVIEIGKEGDAIILPLDTVTADIEQACTDNTLALQFRQNALEAAFPAEMRRRWAERATSAALAFDDLSDEQRDAITAAAEVMTIELEHTRSDALCNGIAKEPEAARQRIEQRFKEQGQGQKQDFDPALWLGYRHEAFERVDNTTEEQLRGVLSPEQFERLPKRRAWNDEAKIVDLKMKNRKETTTDKANSKARSAQKSKSGK